MEFKHISVLLDECIDGLDIKPNGIYIDGTLGGAGHTTHILDKLTTGRVIGLDKDQYALDFCKEKLSKYGDKITLVHSDFKDFDKVLDELNIDSVDGILLDLGVSSYQIDTKERGFSYIQDAPLDMRMDTSCGMTAKDVVNNFDFEELVDIFSRFGEEPYSKRIADAIVKYRQNKDIETTLELADIISQSVPSKDRQKSGHPAKRVFQALRICVNSELDELQDCLIKMARRLKSGGRLCVITFHSLEDRIVKDAFKLLNSDCICDKKLPVCVCHHKKEVELVNRKPILASEQELLNNPRSHSAKLRIVEKI